MSNNSSVLGRGDTYVLPMWLQRKRIITKLNRWRGLFASNLYACCKRLIKGQHTMGHEFEVEVWTYIGSHVEGETSIDDYQWNMEYSGDDKAEAFKALEGLKEGGAKCARLVWR